MSAEDRDMQEQSFLHQLQDIDATMEKMAKSPYASDSQLVEHDQPLNEINEGIKEAQHELEAWLAKLRGGGDPAGPMASSASPPQRQRSAPAPIMAQQAAGTDAGPPRKFSEAIKICP